VSNLLFYVTFSANFFLYCLSGDRFRTALRVVLRRWFCCDADHPSIMSPTQTSRFWSSESRITSQRSTFTSSLACTTVAAMPSTDCQLRPVNCEPNSTNAEDDGAPNKVTAFSNQKPSANHTCHDVDEIRPENDRSTEEQAGAVTDIGGNLPV